MSVHTCIWWSRGYRWFSMSAYEQSIFVFVFLIIFQLSVDRYEFLILIIFHFMFPLFANIYYSSACSSFSYVDCRQTPACQRCRRSFCRNTHWFVYSNVVGSYVVCRMFVYCIWSIPYVISFVSISFFVSRLYLPPLSWKFARLSNRLSVRLSPRWAECRPQTNT